VPVGKEGGWYYQKMIKDLKNKGKNKIAAFKDVNDPVAVLCKFYKELLYQHFSYHRTMKKGEKRYFLTGKNARKIGLEYVAANDPEV